MAIRRMRRSLIGATRCGTMAHKRTGTPQGMSLERACATAVAVSG